MAHHDPHEHRPPAVRRHTDVAVVGGSAAGLAGALQLARQRRGVIVVDAGEPRNAPAAHMHGYLGREGLPPAELVRVGREEVRRYGAEVLDAEVASVRRTDDGFELDLAGGHVVVARRVLLATGLVDELPAIPGVAERWGRDVVHCPFCHGYEVRDRRVVQIVTHPAGLHPTPLLRHLTAALTVVLHGQPAIADDALADLRAAGVPVVTGDVDRLVDGDDGALAGVALANGEVLPADVAVVGPGFRVRAEPVADLGVTPTPHPSGLGDVVAVGADGQTAVAGVYAAGNVTDPSHQVVHAAADGSRVAAMIAFSLAEEDLRTGPRPPAGALDWDDRYGGDALWSGNPNGALVQEVADLAPGRALDVGAGEGGDALWLAERGWTVTATDISRRGLARLEAEARRRGVEVRSLVADANDADPFGGARFDLVLAMYASIPRTGDDRAVRNLLAAVAPGGRLLMVSHDLEPMRAPVEPGQPPRPFDPDAYVRVEDVARVLAATPGWQVEVHETRPRPPGAASASHHLDDVVLRARRRA